MGKTPSEEMLIAMGKYNKKMIKAGTLLDLAELRPRLNWRARSSKALDRARTGEELEKQ